LIEQVEVSIRFINQFFKPSNNKYPYNSGWMAAAVEEYGLLCGQHRRISNVAVILSALICGIEVKPVLFGRFAWLYITLIDPATVRIATKGLLR
jgi:hypothetical protein